MHLIPGINHKTIVITGGTRGVGREFIIAALKANARVSFCWHHSLEKYKDLEEELKIFPKEQWLGIQADVSKEEDVKKLFTKTLEKFSAIDVVISNAAISRDSLLVSLPEELWDEIVGVNLTGAFLVTKMATQYFIDEKRKGRLIIVGSLADSGTPSNACYSLSKGALLGLMNYLHNHYSKEITVNIVTFGLIDTEMTRYYPEEAKQVLIRTSILNRFAKGEEAAKLLLFLSSENGMFLAGKNIHATNGLLDFPILHK